METHGPLGMIWVSVGLISFYLALVWINLILLPLLITPLLTKEPMVWLVGRLTGKRKQPTV